MTHKERIKKSFTVLAETENAIFFDAYGAKVAEINGVTTFACSSIKKFYEMVEMFDNDTFEV